MGKKFEKGIPTTKDIISGYLKLGLGNLLGNPGSHTAVDSVHSYGLEAIEVLCLPGKLSVNEVESLFLDARLVQPRPTLAA